MPNGTVRVTAELDPLSQREQLEMNEESDEYEILTVYGHAIEVALELIDESRTPLLDFKNEEASDLD
jgi:hypothetical protein